MIVFLPKAGFFFFIRVSAKGTEEWYDGFVWKLALQAKASCRSSYRLSLTRIKKCSLGFLFKFQTQGYAGDPNKFVDCALACNAKFIVSEDTHFDELEKIDFPKVDVIGLKEFISLLNK